MTDPILRWCADAVGPCVMVAGAQRPDGRSSTSRLRTATGDVYLKVYDDPGSWHQEVHAYERWAAAFDGFAPRLLAVHDAAPPALIIGAFPGKALAAVDLPVDQERAAWHAAGQMLARLHDFAVGDFFGPCRRDGTPAGAGAVDAVAYVAGALADETEKAIRNGYLSADERAVLRTVAGMVGAFADERPHPCHRDYCPDNWLIDADGVWCGVIDFEFAHWDVRVADFSRYPNWEWLGRPDLVAALFEGYGRTLTPVEEEQRLVAYAQYALSAITWGMGVSYFGFVEEGRQALRRLASLLA